MKRFSFLLILVLILSFACKDKTSNKNKEIPPPAIEDTSLRNKKEATLRQLTNEILSAIKQGEYRKFANFIDPVNGVRFSPYGYVDTLRDMVFSKERFLQYVDMTEQDKLIWGAFDGTGDTILMTIDEYFKRFVYDVDFLNAEKRKMNQYFGVGNSLRNIKAVYKDCDFIENHFQGFEKKYEGMDWRSLRLVFCNRDNRYYLKGLVHDQWTI